MGFVKKNNNLLFYGVTSTSGSTTTTTYYRCKGFTDGSKAKNAKEYARTYIDEVAEENDVISYSPSIAYSFDRIKANAVHDDIIAITDEEKVWDDAVREIVVLDMSSITEDGKVKGKARKYTIVPDADGIGEEVLQYTGNFKSKSKVEVNEYTSADDFETITKVVQA